MIKEDIEKEGWILPGALVPFRLDNKKARGIFKNWVSRIWFAPGKLKRAALDPEAIHGLYIPFWTFDTNLYASYEGQRGDYYYETQTYRTKKGMQTRQVRKTRWSPASGSVKGFIDDILINASEEKRRDIPRKIANWNLNDLVTYNSKFLAGFVTKKYSVSLKDGHHQSFQKAKQVAYNWIRQDIGGDTQRIVHTDIKLSDETFKHILLPVYISSYRYKTKEYHFFVNGQTGAINGTHPYSFWKIFFLILFVVIIIVLITIFAQ